MILILTAEYDQTSNDVIDWLIFHKKDFVRINSNDFITLNILKIQNNKVNINLNCRKNFFNRDVLVDLETVASYWYRRGNFNIFSFLPDFSQKIDKKIYKIFSKYLLVREKNTIKEYLHFFLRNKLSINSYQDNLINKLFVLDIAQSIGLRVPTSIVTNDDNILRNNFSSIQRLINKGIKNPGFETPKGLLVGAGTLEHMIDKNKEPYFYSFFQPLIDKKYELRVFIFDGKCYSAAIMSQSKERTIDFRDYNDTDSFPHRIIPYNLPKDYSDKLILLCQKLNLDSCSADIIVDENGEYYFLEVNPVGQFGFISGSCNYNLEMIIANKLIEYDN